MFLGYYVTSVHSLQFLCYILLMTWHYKRLTSYQQNTHIEIIYSVRASRASEENVCISTFQTCSIN